MPEITIVIETGYENFYSLSPDAHDLLRLCGVYKGGWCFRGSKNTVRNIAVFMESDEENVIRILNSLNIFIVCLE